MNLTPSWLTITLKEGGIPWELKLVTIGVLLCSFSFLVLVVVNTYAMGSAYEVAPWLTFGRSLHHEKRRLRVARFFLLQKTVLGLTAVSGVGTGISIGVFILSTIRPDSASFPLFANPFVSFSNGPRIYLPIGPSSLSALGILLIGWTSVAALLEAVAVVIDNVEGERYGIDAGCWVAVGIFCAALHQQRYFDAVPFAAGLLATQWSRHKESIQLVPEKAAAAVRAFAETQPMATFHHYQIRWLQRLLHSPNIGLVVNHALLEHVAKHQQVLLVKVLLLEREPWQTCSNASIFEKELHSVDQSSNPNLARVLRYLISEEKGLSFSSTRENSHIKSRARRHRARTLDEQYKKWDSFEDDEGISNRNSSEKKVDNEPGRRVEIPRGEGWLKWEEASFSLF